MNTHAIRGLFCTVALIACGALPARAESPRPKLAKSIESIQWFPDEISVAVTNRALYYVPDPVGYQHSPSLKDCQRIQRGGQLTLRKGDGSEETRVFQVAMILSNAVMLSVRGTLQQKTVPIVIINPPTAR